MSSHFSTVGFMAFVAFVATIVFTILAYKYIVSESKRPGLNKLGQFLNDLVNFKFLVIEKILQFFYVLTTIACICGGICMIFAFESYSYTLYGQTQTSSQWYGWVGILAVIFGPVLIRIVYEGMMLFLLLVKNVIQINKRLNSQDSEEYKVPSLKELLDKENFSFLRKNNN